VRANEVLPVAAISDEAQKILQRTISTDDHHTLQEFRASVGAEWIFLSDPGRTIQKGLDIHPGV